MKKLKFPVLMAILAAAAFGLRWGVYATAVDEKNLIIAGHPIVVVLWVLTAAALGLAAFAAWKTKEESLSFDAFAPAFLGHGLLGAALAVTVLLNPLPMPGILGQLWKILALVSAPCLLFAGFERMRGKMPFFGLYALPCLFFAVHVVAHYQSWCANPQFTDYAFGLLASVALALHCYQLSAFSAEMGEKKMLVLTGLAALFLCVGEMANGLYPYLYLGGAVFCLTNPSE